MDQLLELSVFAGKLFFILLLLGSLALLVAALVARQKAAEEVKLENLGLKFKAYQNALRSLILDKKKAKLLAKEQKKKKEPHPQTVFVIDFHGDLKASAAKSLRQELNAILGCARPGDEVLLRLESPGGMVHGYGLAAAELLRLKKASIPLVVSVDQIAASGGYLMATAAQKIIAAPFAVIGSIGVLAQVPNLHRFLKTHNVDYEEITAGEYKRTVSILGEITEKGRQKFLEQIEDTHALFKNFVSENRPQLDIEKVGTGEYWYGKRALDLKLVDEIMTSDDYLLSKLDHANLIRVEVQEKKTLSERFSYLVSQSITETIHRVSQIHL